MHKSLAIAAIGLILVGLTGASVPIPGYPWAGAALNADKSAVIVTGSNTGDTNYTCMVTGRIRVTEQRAFAKLDCRFNLPGNTAERQFCEQSGNGPGSLASIEGDKFTCVPN